MGLSAHDCGSNPHWSTELREQFDAGTGAVNPVHFSYSEGKAMSVRIIEGEYDGTTNGAVMVDSVTEWAFGPIFESTEEADLFILWHMREFGVCVRRATQPQLADRFGNFRKLVTRCSECDDLMLGGATCKDCMEDIASEPVN